MNGTQLMSYSVALGPLSGNFGLGMQPGLKGGNLGGVSLAWSPVLNAGAAAQAQVTRTFTVRGIGDWFKSKLWGRAVIALVTAAFAIAWACLLLGLIAMAVLAFRFSATLKREQRSMFSRAAMVYSWPYHVLRSSTWSSAADRRLAGLARVALLLGVFALVFVLFVRLALSASRVNRAHPGQACRRPHSR